MVILKLLWIALVILLWLLSQLISAYLHVKMMERQEREVNP